MILSCNFEELRALASGADMLLASPERANPLSREALAGVQEMVPRLTGDIDIDTVAEQQALRSGVAAVTGSLRDRMEAAVLEHHPGYEDAVLLYFEYAHALTILARLDRMGAEMAALEELMYEVEGTR